MQLITFPRAKLEWRQVPGRMHTVAVFPAAVEAEQYHGDSPGLACLRNGMHMEPVSATALWRDRPCTRFSRPLLSTVLLGECDYRLIRDSADTPPGRNHCWEAKPMHLTGEGVTVLAMLRAAYAVQASLVTFHDYA